MAKIYFFQILRFFTYLYIEIYMYGKRWSMLLKMFPMISWYEWWCCALKMGILTCGHVARASSSRDALPSAASVCSTVRPQESAWLMSPLSPSSSVNGSLGDSSIGLTSCETCDKDHFISYINSISIKELHLKKEKKFTLKNHNLILFNNFIFLSNMVQII